MLLTLFASCNMEIPEGKIKDFVLYDTPTDKQVEHYKKWWGYLNNEVEVEEPFKEFGYEEDGINEEIDEILGFYNLIYREHPKEENNGQSIVLVPINRIENSPKFDFIYRNKKLGFPVQPKETWRSH